MINLDKYKQLILNLLRESGLGEESLVLHKNPYMYASQKNLSNIKEGMIGFSFTERNSDKKTVVLKMEILDQEQNDALERIAFPSDRGRKQFLRKPEKFVEHLVRHEIEHCVFRKPQAQEHEADGEVDKVVNALTKWIAQNDPETAKV